MTNITLVTNFDSTKTPVENTPEFRANASYVWGMMPTVITTWNASVHKMNILGGEIAALATQVSTDKDTVVAKEALVSPHYASIDTVSTNIANVNTTATSIANVNTIATNIASINTVANVSNLADIITVADDLNSLDLNGIADVTIVANDLVLGASSVTVKVATDIANVNLVSTNINDVNTNAINIASINTNATNIVAIQNAESNASIAQGSANNKGNWSALTGALNIPASVNHNGNVYVLNVNLADVTLSEPTDINTDWTDVTIGLAELALKADISGASFTGGVSYKNNTLVTNIDCNIGNSFSKTVTADFIQTFSNIPINGIAYMCVLKLINGGAFVITWDASIEWSKGASPTLSANGKDTITLYTDDGGITWQGNASTGYL